MERILLTIALLVLGTIMAGAQDLNGIDVGTPMPKSTVKSLFGQWEYIEEDEESLMTTYMYNNNHDELVTYDNDNKVGRFCITKNKRFKVLTKLVPGGIGIGDNISKLTAKIKFTEYKDGTTSKYIVFRGKLVDEYVYGAQCDCPLSICTRNGIVISFEYDELPI
jgi:hypothetical protein